jgi:hypothetical protein
MWCKRCSYPLDGLSEPRCPECGREFDPRDGETFSILPTAGQCPACTKRPERLFFSRFVLQENVICQYCEVQLERDQLSLRWQTLFCVFLGSVGLLTGGVSWLFAHITAPNSIPILLGIGMCAASMCPSAVLTSILSATHSSYMIQQTKNDSKNSSGPTDDEKGG